MKECYKCKIKKDINQYGNMKSKKDGLDHICKPCRKQEYLLNRENRLKILYNSRNKNKEDYLRKRREYKRRKRIELGLPVREIKEKQIVVAKPGQSDFVGPIIPSNLRLCPFCGLFKELGEVCKGKNKHGEITFHNQCKKCKKRKSVEYHHNVAKLKPDYRKRVRDYQIKNRAKLSLKVKNWRKNNPEKAKQALQKYRASEKGKETKRKYKQKLKQRIINVVRDEIRRLMRNGKMVKNDSTMNYLGCDWETFKNHIESQFEPWMNWDNHGTGYLLQPNGKPVYDENGLTIPVQEWSFDHISPCENFDLESYPEQAYICFNYKNYRPLLAKKNSEKGDLLPDGTRARHKKKEEFNELVDFI